MEKKETKNRSTILKVWGKYEFKLFTPTSINKDNKIEVHFNFFNQETGKNKQIKRSTGIDRYSKAKIYTQQANDLIEVLIEQLEANYDFINNCYPDYVKLTPQSNISECFKSWLKLRAKDNADGVIKKNELDITGYVFDYYTAYLKKNNHLFEKPSYFTVNDINNFMRKIEKTRRLSPFTYNSYQSRITFFYDFLINERVTVFNPSSKAFRYKTKHMKTRFEEFDDATLLKIQNYLKNDPKFLDLYVASKLLFEYSIREVEQLRIQLSWIDWKTGILTLPEKTIEDGKAVNATKNGIGAKYKLEDDILELLADYIDERNAKENYLFGGHNRPSLKRMNDAFLNQRWHKFRELYDLPKSLKMYALKHTGNYNSLDTMRPDQLSTINRQIDDKSIQTYLKKRKLDVIKLGDKKRF